MSETPREALIERKTIAITVAGGGRRVPEQVEVPDLPMHLSPDSPRNCPSCESPNPALHPAVQHEGEVQPCSDEWHRLTRPGMEAWSRVADCAAPSERVPPSR